MTAASSSGAGAGPAADCGVAHDAPRTPAVADGPAAGEAGDATPPVEQPPPDSTPQPPAAASAPPAEAEPTSPSPGGEGLALAEAFGAVFAPPSSQREEDLAERAAQEGLARATQSVRLRHGRETLLHELLDCGDTLNAAAAAIVDDTFTKCFKSNAPDPWNWNVYLFPLWCAGVVVRYGILFPIRLLTLTLGFVVFFLLFLPVHYLSPRVLRAEAAEAERSLIEMLAATFVFSWTGVVRYHGPRPSRRPQQVFVANHTSMIDFIVLEQSTPFAVIMQKHGGWVGWMQSVVLASLGCIHFNRGEAADRANVAARIKRHVHDPHANPLLIFPEGTCVNNEYCVMFKKGAFELGVTVCPIAIKYNKIFVDAFWNSRREGFTSHLTRLMTSWALVADVWYMEPQARGEGETAEAFAERVRELIADRAGLKCVPWDGMLKYYRRVPSAKQCEKQREAFAQRMLRHLGDAATPPSPHVRSDAAAHGAAADEPSHLRHRSMSSRLAQEVT